MQLNSEVFNTKLYLTLKASAHLTTFKCEFSFVRFNHKTLGTKHFHI